MSVPDQTADCTRGAALIAGIEAEYLLADRGYDFDGSIEQAKRQGMEPDYPAKKESSHTARLRRRVV